jgi:hypothetical protein
VSTKAGDTCSSHYEVKLSLCLTNEALRQEGVWGSGCIDPHFLDAALAGGEWSASRPGRFTLGERAPSTHRIGGCVDPRAGLDDVEKIIDPTGTRTPTPRSSSQCLPLMGYHETFLINLAFKPFKTMLTDSSTMFRRKE